MSKYIPFRLRPLKDDDIDKGIDDELNQAAQQLQELDRSDIIRAALRFYFRYKNAFQPFSSAANVPSGTPAQSHETFSVVEQHPEPPQRTPLREQMKKAPANNAGATWRPSGR